MSHPFRADFPLLAHTDIAFLDSAATSQRPECVIQAEKEYYERYNANPLRGFYDLAQEATARYEGAREKVRAFLNADNAEEIIFTRNTTESINLVAWSWGLSNLKKGDEILITISEHHSNILPWQMVARQKKARLVYLECLPDGTITDEEIESKLTDRTKLVGIGHVSNVMGVTNPVEKIIALAHQKGAVVLVDGAQSAPHMPIDVRKMDADFFAFSGHKLCGPMGIGVLYGKKELLEDMPPFLTGGEMIEYVTRESATYAELPHKFEAGTVNATGAVGLEAAIRYIQEIGFETIMKTEETLTARLIARLRETPHVTVYGQEDPSKHCGIVTFNIEGCHPHDVASVLDTENIYIRAGHHCAQPLMKWMGVGSTARASLYFYNTEEEVDRFADKISQVRGWLGYGD